MNLDNERKAFEGWAYSNKWNICRYPKSDHHMKEGQYCDEFVNGAWHGWLASASREGYKLVPVEPTERMLDSAYSSISDNLHYADLENIYKAMIGACDDH